MPVPSKRLKELVEGTVDHHASLTHAHPGLQEITIRWRGSSGYMDAWAGTDVVPPPPRRKPPPRADRRR